MKRIEVHDYRTPTEDNRDCPFSVGVMNLTKDEVGYVREFIVNLSRLRWEKLQAMKATATETREAERSMRRAQEAERAFRGERPDLYAADRNLVTGKGEIVRPNLYFGTGDGPSVNVRDAVEEARRYMTGERVTVTLSTLGLTAAEIAEAEESIVRENSKPEPEPEPVRNRFSGLDIE